MGSFYIGGEDFPELIKRKCYYVDKTYYLQKIFNEDIKAALFTRPRRFGKTLNMSMIKAFCKLNYRNPGDKTYQENIFLDNDYDLIIAQDEFWEFRDNFMGEFPVISFSRRVILIPSRRTIPEQ